MGLMVGKQRETAAASGMEGKEGRPLRGASPGLCLRLDAAKALGTYLAGSWATLSLAGIQKFCL